MLCLITIVCSCAFLLFGYDNGVLSGLLVCPWYLNQFNNPNPTLTGTISAMYNGGGALGGTVAFFIGGKLGRRKTIVFGFGITFIGAIIQCTSLTVAQLIVGRIICGTGVGTLTSTVGLWQGEVSPEKMRGRYLAILLLCGTGTGLFLAQWINYGFSTNNGKVAFVFPLAFQLLFITLAAVLVLLGLPESPRWLYREGRHAEALAVLVQLESGNDIVIREERAKKKYLEIVEVVKLENLQNKSQYAALFSNGPTQNFRRLCLACGTMIFHQLAGPNTVTYYLPTLLVKFIGASRQTALWVAGLSSVVAIFFCILTVFAIDRFGRRPLLWGGAVIQCITFAIVAGLLANSPAQGSQSIGVAIVVFIFFFYGINGLTWLGPSWAYPAEILPLQIREKGLALGNICYWAFQVMVVEITPIGLANIGYKFYIIFTLFNAFIAVVVYFCWVETNQLSLEQIDFYFAKRFHGGQELREVEAQIAERKDEIINVHVEDTSANVPEAV